MENIVKESVKENEKHRVRSIKWYKNWKFITTGIIIIIALIIGRN